jgi:adenosylmethionine---8-amino-7-oxononanoate aminotransferase
MATKDTLRSLDLEHLWHPYTDIAAHENARFPIIEKAQGVYLYDDEGRSVLDGISSWWACNLGHGHPRLVDAIRRQAGELEHSILGGMSHPNAIRLAGRLARFAPWDLTRAFFASDGACAIEAALKIAVQYWSNVGEPRRNEFACLAEGYHGDTLGAVGVGFVPEFHECFEPIVRKGRAAASPHCFHCPCGKTPGTCDIECFGSMENIFRAHHETLAAVIVEPLCQGAAGMRIYPDEYLRRLRRLCDERSVLLIADEIAVGFGRTGSMFACEHAGIVPDIMCLGKGLTGGHLPMSATLVTEKIYDAFRNVPGRDRTFYHGHTYCGNPITSALALAALDVYEEEKIVEKSQSLVAALKAGIERIRECDGVSNACAMGMMGVVEIAEETGGARRAKTIAAKAYELGLFIRPLGPILYLWPPLTTSQEELGRMLLLFEEALAKVGDVCG